MYNVNCLDQGIPSSKKTKGKVNFFKKEGAALKYHFVIISVNFQMFKKVENFK